MGPNGKVPSSNAANNMLHTALKNINASKEHHLPRTATYTRLIFDLQGRLNLLHFSAIGTCKLIPSQ